MKICKINLLQELYNAWLDRQLSLLEVGDGIEPPGVHSIYDCLCLQGWRLLLDSAPLSKVNHRVLAERENDGCMAVGCRP